MQYKKQGTRDKILACALEEFYKYGESNASIRRIAEKAEVAVGNIYNYFDSKRAIFDAIINPVAQGINGIFDQIMEFGLSIKKVDELVETAVPYMVKNRRELRLLMNTASDKGGLIKEDFFNQFSYKIKGEIDVLREKMDKQPISKEYSRALSKSFLYGVFEILFSSEDSRAVTAMLKDYFVFFFGGLESRT
ncbi:MAG: TetR/AcrR family transcriptional regulator [Clostridia bacterium]|nr:TetR/AcrR family transcriptional regulator [Clostridia bacterium]